MTGPIGLRRYAGRIVGVLIGILAGPAGVVFGLLAGWLIDQYRLRNPIGTGIATFLSDPVRRVRTEHGVTFGCAAVLVVLHAQHGPVADDTAAFLEGERWPHDRGIDRDGAFRRAVIDGTIRERYRIDLEAIAAALVARLASEQRMEILDLAIRSLAFRGTGIDLAERDVLATVADTFGIDRDETIRREAIHGTLSRRECEILGIGRDSDRAQIRREYRALVAQLHPDTGAPLNDAQREILHAAFLRVQDAYTSLMRQLDERESFSRTR
jgi:DnaJ-domain-containing protein 1